MRKKDNLDNESSNIDVQNKRRKSTSRTKGKSHFKMYLLVIELIALAVSAGSSLWMNFTLGSKTRYEAEYTDKTSFYLDSNFDLLVSGASKEQTEEYGRKDFVQNVTPASKISLSVKTGSVEDYRDLLIFDSDEALEHTEFTEKRLIKKSNTENHVYADYKFCELYNVNLGDSITISSSGERKEYCISRVYRTDYSYPEGILIMTKGTLPLESKSQLMYVTAKDKEKLVDDLKNYKPLGTLLDKKDTQTDEEYQKYLDEFNSKKYFDSYVTDNGGASSRLEQGYSEKIASSARNFYISVSVVSVACLVVSLFCFFINAKNKKDRFFKYIQENGRSKLVGMFSAFDFSFVLFSVIGSLLAIKESLSSATAYYTFASALASSYLCVLLPVAGILIGYLITIVTIKRA